VSTTHWHLYAGRRKLSRHCMKAYYIRKSRLTYRASVHLRRSSEVRVALVGKSQLPDVERSESFKPSKAQRKAVEEAKAVARSDSVMKAKAVVKSAQAHFDESVEWLSRAEGVLEALVVITARSISPSSACARTTRRMPPTRTCLPTWDGCFELL
jgi:hypothetical protein